jgi:bifunctional lysine-specific demethylase and histidyl-hydroxylase NO66
VTDPSRSLVRCVGDVETFLAEAWTRRPHLDRADGDDYGDLLSLDAVDHILTTMALRDPAFRLVERGSVIARSRYTRSGTVGGRRINDLIDVGRVMDLFADGATIVLQGLHRYWPPVTDLCRDLEEVLTHPVQANAYVTPPVASGLRVHHDTHDVFALQTHGEKHWVCYEPVLERPLSGQGWSSDEHEVGEPVLDTMLRPGDSLYLPRGTPHAARTTNAPSIHLTIGIRQITWHDVLDMAVERAIEEVSFRESLPAGFAHDPTGLEQTVATRLKEMSDWIASVDPAELAAAAADRFRRSRQPHLRGQLEEVLGLDTISHDTTVRARPHRTAHLSRDDDRVVIELGDREVRLPAPFEPVLRRLLAGDPVRVGDLHELDEDSRPVLVRRLVREGLLTVVRD